MHASVRIRDHQGAVHDLVHGDLIGRVWSATLQRTPLDRTAGMLTVRPTDRRWAALDLLDDAAWVIRVCRRRGREEAARPRRACLGVGLGRGGAPVVETGV